MADTKIIAEGVPQNSEEIKKEAIPFEEDPTPPPMPDDWPEESTDNQAKQPVSGSHSIGETPEETGKQKLEEELELEERLLANAMEDKRIEQVRARYYPELDAVSKLCKDKPFFDVDMTTEELVDRFIFGVNNTKEPAIFNVDGTEVEGVKESQDSIEQKAIRKTKADPNLFEDGMKDINVYLNGQQVTKEEFATFVDAHKESFVAACNQFFPDLTELYLAKQKDLSIFEKDYVLQKVKSNPVPAFKLEMPATKSEQVKAEDLDTKIRAANVKKARDEWRSAGDKLFDRPENRINATFYLYGKNGDVESTLEFQKYVTKDGDVRASMKMDGQYIRGEVLTKKLQHYPNQLGKQVDAYIRKLDAEKGRKENSKEKPKEEMPER